MITKLSENNVVQLQILYCIIIEEGKTQYIILYININIFLNIFINI